MMDDTQAESAVPLSPASRAKAGARGVPVVLGDVAEWLLAHGGLSPLLDDARDTLFDRAMMTDKVPLDEVRSVAWALLRANYDLGGDEAARLVVGAEGPPLVDATLDALYGPDRDRRDDRTRTTYTVWARTSLYANGLDPDRIDPALIRDVLDQLVVTGRAVPAAKVVTTIRQGTVRKKMLTLRDQIDAQKKGYAASQAAKGAPPAPGGVNP